MMEPDDKSSGWLVDDCKMVAGVYSKLAMYGSTGAIVEGCVQGAESESEESERGQWVQGGYIGLCAGGDGVSGGKGEDGRVDGEDGGLVSCSRTAASVGDDRNSPYFWMT